MASTHEWPVLVLVLVHGTPCRDIFDREREHGRFKGSIKGASREQDRAQGSNTGARESMQGYTHADTIFSRGAASKSLN